MTRVQARARTRTAWGWSLPRLDGLLVDLGGPGAGVSAVVGEGGHGDAEAFVAGPPEVHGPVFAGRLGDRADPGQRGDGVGRVVGCAGVAPLGEHLGGVDLTRPWQRREDRARPGAPRGGRPRTGRGPCVTRAEGASAPRPGPARRRGRLRSRSRSLVPVGAGAQPGEQLGGGAAAGVAVFDAECRSRRFSPRCGGGGRGRVAGQERPARSATRCRRRSPWRRASGRRAARRAGWSRRPASRRCRRGCGPRCAAPWSAPSSGVAGRSRCARSRRYSAITAASPASDFAPDSTSRRARS